MDVRHISIDKRTVRLGRVLPIKEPEKKERLDGWTYVGSFGFSHIYAKGDSRCLIDPKTGNSTFEYKITMSNKRYDARKQAPPDSLCKQWVKQAQKTSDSGWI